MKRSPLKRKTRTRRRETAAMDARKVWSQRFQSCFVCWRLEDFPPLQTHEISRRSKGGEWQVEANLIRTCQRCHEEVLSWAPPELQLAFKYLADEEHFDLAVVNQLRNRAVGSCTWGDVRKWIQVIQALRGQ